MKKTTKTKTTAKKTEKRGKHCGRLEKRGNTWLAIWMVHGKRYSKSTGETDREKAERWLARQTEIARREDEFAKADELKRIQIETAAASAFKDIANEADEIRRKAVEEMDGVALRFDEAWGAYVRTPKRKNVTPETLAHLEMRYKKLRAWIEKQHPEITELRHVTTEIAEEYAATIRGEYVPATYNMALAAYSQIWARLATEIKAKVNPWTREHLPRLDMPDSERRDIDDGELARIFEAARKEKPPLHYLFTVMLYTGARLGDCAQMEWRHVDLRRGFISFMPQKTKRFKIRVNVPILPPLRAMLESFPADKRTGYIMPDMAAEYQARRLSPTITNFLSSKCDIETSRKTNVGKRRHAVVTAHSFRHTFISKAANAGIPFAIVQAIVGHSTAKQCKAYFHENEDATLRAFAAFPVADSQPVPAIENCPGDVIEAEAVVVAGDDPNADAAARRRAALESILDEIARNGDAEERQAVAAILTQRAREIVGA